MVTNISGSPASDHVQELPKEFYGKYLLAAHEVYSEDYLKKELNAFKDAHPDCAQAWTMLGRLHWQDKVQSIDFFRRALEIDPTEPGANILLALCADPAMPCPSDIARRLEVCLDHSMGHPDEPELLRTVLKIADAYELEEITERAQALGEKRFPEQFCGSRTAVTVLPHEFQDKCWQATALGYYDYDKLIEELHGYLDQHPDCVGALNMLANMSFDEQQCLEYHRSALQFDPGDPEANLHMAKLLSCWRASDRDIADHLQRCLANLRGHRIEYQLLRDVIEISDRHGLDDIEGAARAFADERFFGQFKYYPSTGERKCAYEYTVLPEAFHRKLNGVFMRRYDGDTLEQEIEHFIAEHPNCPQAWYMLGDMYLLDEQLSLGYFREVLRLDPGEPAANIEVASKLDPQNTFSDIIARHIEVFLANGRGHTDEDAMLSSAFGLADEYGLPEIKARLKTFADERFPGQYDSED